eukprot:CAMPEP_0114681432 /NCGR_PEP_ID=MMETSP0191-20121206/55370_1 /TAXON_ID=126664 /ORGANISM="Sorites sp." /LENGTH=44 /DNA_ID= /DNA_START= /DNA_END= /DNA_ORIENTATION=
MKAAKWNMPLAFAVGKLYSDYTTLPTLHKTMFYWWTPDPTFLEM